jgi:hypothetical protein
MRGLHAMHDEDHDELVLLRTHLTVALLAVSQLRRKHAQTPHVARLSAYALDALMQMREQMAQVDRLIARLEKLTALRDEPLRFPISQRRAVEEMHERH